MSENIESIEAIILEVSKTKYNSMAEFKEAIKDAVESKDFSESEKAGIYSRINDVLKNKFIENYLDDYVDFFKEKKKE